MATNPFELTPEQKGLLVTLAQETGKPIPALMAEALEGLQEQVHPRADAPTTSGNGGHAEPPADHESQPGPKHSGDRCRLAQGRAPGGTGSPASGWGSPA